MMNCGWPSAQIGRAAESLSAEQGGCKLPSDKTRQGYAPRSSLKRAGCFMHRGLQRRLAELGYSARALGRQTGILTRGSQTSSILANTPAMPLTEAHFGGFFVSGGCA